MRIILGAVMAISFSVDMLLLIGSGRLSGCPVDWGRLALAAGVGAVYAGACMVPQFSFLGSLLWRLVCLGLMGALAFGLQISALHGGSLLVLLSMALEGLAVGAESSIWTTASALVVFALAMVGFRGSTRAGALVPVYLRHGDIRVQLLALRDTGNTLRDPLTGQSVLVANAAIARRLTGLSREQLASPVETMAAGGVPGLRLIPYRTVGKQGLLLAIRVGDAKIGDRRGSVVVAFAPEGLDGEGTYQALTGGAV